jgi:hypothetical protein
MRYVKSNNFFKKKHEGLVKSKKTRIIISRDVLRCVKYGIPSHPHPGNPFGKTSAFVKKNERRDCIQDLREVSAVPLLRGS